MISSSTNTSHTTPQTYISNKLLCCVVDWALQLPLGHRDLHSRITPAITSLGFSTTTRSELDSTLATVFMLFIPICRHCRWRQQIFYSLIQWLMIFIKTSICCDYKNSVDCDSVSLREISRMWYIALSVGYVIVAQICTDLVCYRKSCAL